MSESKLTKVECLEILSLYRNWNCEQTSIALAFRGIREPVDDMYDSRRELLKSVHATLQRMAIQTGHPDS